MDQQVFKCEVKRKQSETKHAKKRSETKPRENNAKKAKRNVKEQKLNNSIGSFLAFLSLRVPDHDGGRPKQINAWFLYTHMVYL